MSEWLENTIGVDNQEKLPTKDAKEKLGGLESEIRQEQKTILYLAYLTTLARLPKNRDLDELFDWEIQLWEEEMFSIYSLIEMINWSNSITHLKPPREMSLDRNLAQDYTYKINYDEYYLVDWNYVSNDKLVWISEEQKKWLKTKRVVKTLEWDWFLPLNKTNLIFNYDSNLNISGIVFERPINLNDGGLGLNQEIKLSRNTNWLVDKISIDREMEFDNELSISYNNFWKPEVIEQTKLWLMSDKIVFEYDDNWNLVSIIYVPTLSLKHIKWLKQAYKSWKNSRWVLKWVQLASEFITYEALKKIKWNDVITINNNNWLPVSTEANLDSSNWVYKKWFSKMKYWENQKLQELYLEMEELWPDDKKTIKLKY